MKADKKIYLNLLLMLYQNFCKLTILQKKKNNNWLPESLI